MPEFKNYEAGSYVIPYATFQFQYLTNNGGVPIHRVRKWSEHYGNLVEITKNVH
jgi:hypothetical protein